MEAVVLPIAVLAALVLNTYVVVRAMRRIGETLSLTLHVVRDVDNAVNNRARGDSTVSGDVASLVQSQVVDDAVLPLVRELIESVAALTERMERLGAQ